MVSTFQSYSDVTMFAFIRFIAYSFHLYELHCCHIAYEMPNFQIQMCSWNIVSLGMARLLQCRLLRLHILRYKSEYRGFDSRWCNWNFSLTYSFRPHYGPGLTQSVTYFLGGKGGRCLGLTTLPPSCADCLEIWEPQAPGILWACPDL